MLNLGQEITCIIKAGGLTVEVGFGVSLNLELCA